MSQFRSRPPRQNEESHSYVYDQMLSVEKAFIEPAEFLALAELHNEPNKVFTGMIVLADGTNWNPGSGVGVYCYHSAQWNKLG